MQNKKQFKVNEKPAEKANINIDKMFYPQSGAEIFISSDEKLKEQNIEDRIINREQRTKIAKRISLMMVWEVAVIGGLLCMLITIPFLNALQPQITIKTPPLFFTMSSILSYLFIVKYIDLLPEIRITYSKLKIKRIPLQTNCIIKTILIILFFLVINLLPKTTYTFTFQAIEIYEPITKLILCTALAVFTKTTILGKDIIKNLYELMKNHHLN